MTKSLGTYLTLNQRLLARMPHARNTFSITLFDFVAKTTENPADSLLRTKVNLIRKKNLNALSF